ncbi:MAG: DUF808 domain-containing protein [Pseudomonadota bacterium]|nr:DUF808 domain-containing protein [Pseudomonadota bacterium]
MAFGSLLALIDDIATVLDDVAAMSKLAAKKTTGVLGDDLALNAQQVSGIRAERELPVVWAVTKGSLRNKLILVPAALLISAFAPWAVILLLMAGGLYLCFEGVEKVLHSVQHKPQQAEEKGQLTAALQKSPEDLLAFEQDKIRGAVRTDFILSAEIIVITLGSVADAAFMTQVVVVSLLALAFTFGVYGIVAAIVKMDDVGLYFSQRDGQLLPVLGRGLVTLAPWLMKTLSVVGTLAMFLVGGGILMHGLAPLEHLSHAITETLDGGILSALVPVLLNLLVGFMAGAVLVGAWSLWQRFRPRTAG